MTDTTPDNLQAETLLKTQIEAFTNFEGQLTPGSAAKKVMADIKAKSADLWKLPPGAITVIPGYNPRVQNAGYFAEIKALAENMLANGYMQDKPLSAYIAKIDGADVLALQDGHRRHAAVQLAIEMGAPIKEVPVVLKDRSLTQADLTKALLHSNEGKPFTVYEKAVIAKRFRSFGWEIKDIAKEMACTPTYVSQLLDLAGAPDAIQQLVSSGEVSATHAYEAMKQHGAEAAQVLTATVAVAKKTGKKATKKRQAEVLSPTEERKAQKTKNARKVAYELYDVLRKVRNNPDIEKRLGDREIEKIDELVAVVETKPKVKEPKEVKAPRAIKVKEPKAPKAAAAKKAPWDQPGAKKGSKLNGAHAAARGEATTGRQGQ